MGQHTEQPWEEGNILPRTREATESFLETARSSLTMIGGAEDWLLLTGLPERDRTRTAYGSRHRSG